MVQKEERIFFSFKAAWDLCHFRRLVHAEEPMAEIQNNPETSKMPSKINSDLWLCLTCCWLLMVGNSLTEFMHCRVQYRAQRAAGASAKGHAGTDKHRHVWPSVPWAWSWLAEKAVSCSDIVFHATVVVAVVVVAVAAAVIVVRSLKNSTASLYGF